MWEDALAEGLINDLTAAGALIGNAGCAGCAAGQIGQNGPGEVTLSSGNRNFAGKQGKGEVYLASPQTCAASALAGVIATADAIPAAMADTVRREGGATGAKPASRRRLARPAGDKPTLLQGRAWVVDVDNIDTDMIFHNKHLAITDIAQMGQHTFGNLPGWEDFPPEGAAGRHRRHRRQLRLRQLAPAGRRLLRRPGRQRPGGPQLRRHLRAQRHQRRPAGAGRRPAQVGARRTGRRSPSI